MVGTASGTGGGGGSGRVHFRSQSGCCVCGTKSSSSRFIVSQRYSEHFTGCFGPFAANRKGDLCNACVLCVKRWLKANKQPGWFAQVLDSKKGPGPKHMKEITKRARRREARLAAVTPASSSTCGSGVSSTSTASPSSLTNGLARSRQTGTGSNAAARRGYSPGRTVNSFPLAGGLVNVASQAVAGGHYPVRHRQPPTADSRVWSRQQQEAEEEVFWRTVAGRGGAAGYGAGTGQKRFDQQANSADLSGLGGPVRQCAGGENLVNSAASPMELASDEKSGKSAVARTTCTRAATIRRLEAKSASVAASRALSSSSTRNRVNLSYSPDLMPVQTGASAASSKTTSDYGSAGSSLSGCSSISSAFSASSSSSSCCYCCCCCNGSYSSCSAYSSSNHHQPTSGVPSAVARGQQAVMETTTSASLSPVCGCLYVDAKSVNGGSLRNTSEVSYKRPKYDNAGCGAGAGRDRQSSTGVTRPMGGNCSGKRVQPCDSSHRGACADGYPARHSAVGGAFRKCCCCRHDSGGGAVTGTSVDSRFAEFRLPPPPGTGACGDHVFLRRHANATSSVGHSATTGSAAKSVSPLGSSVATAGNEPQTSQKGGNSTGLTAAASTLAAATTIATTAPLGNSAAQSARRYNRRVVLPPVRMTDNPQLDALYREIMDLNSQAVNFDSREIHMAVQHRLRQRNRITATSSGGSLSGQATTTSSSVSSADGSSSLEQQPPGLSPVANGTVEGHSAGAGLPAADPTSKVVELVGTPASRQIAKRHHPCQHQHLHHHHHHHHHKAA